MSKRNKRSSTRREFLTGLSETSAAALLGGFALALPGCGGGGSSAPPPPPPGDGYPGTDDQLMEEIEKAAFQFFWEQADPTPAKSRIALWPRATTRTPFRALRQLDLDLPRFASAISAATSRTPQFSVASNPR